MGSVTTNLLVGIYHGRWCTDLSRAGGAEGSLASRPRDRARDYGELKPRESALAYTTALSLLQTMEKKGLVGHESAGTVYRYYAKVRRDSVFRKLAAGFLDEVFDGAMGEYMARALQSRRPSLKELEELEAMIAEAKKRARERDVKEGRK